ncbi:MAG: prolyl oligopeptidase family serine peptidase [Verrucomicrobiota bacterium]|nr:prolyl oligopeptidase family serine peptidase [Verrucomicrobiota bacterium]
MRLLPLLVTVFITPALVLAQPAPKKQVPPPGVKLPAADRKELETGSASLGREIESARAELQSRPALVELLPDVQIFHNAVRYALTYDEFLDLKQVPIAKSLLAEGQSRLKALRAGQAPWAKTTGLVVRGFVSKIDASVQPYGVVVPAAWKPDDKQPRRLDIWLLGRGEKRTELEFLAERMKKPPEFTPEGAFVVVPYGRFCNATKFAGETDVSEALGQARKWYPIDENRIAVRGFSMGGASAWHLAVHHAGRWAAAAPGAGFAETAEYGKVFAEGKEPPPWWEQVLWRWYDATVYAANLLNCPVIAYSGELDKQKQAAEIMAKAMAAEGLTLTHLVGPKTEHKYEPETKKELARRIDELVAKGREPVPAKVRFTTYTLRYPRMEWVAIDAMEKHWERADLNAELVDTKTIKVQTKNVAAFTLELNAEPVPLDSASPPRVLVDADELTGPPVTSPWKAHFRKDSGKWSLVKAPAEGMPALRKRPGLNGPIDDAFMDSFLFVRPTGKPLNEKVGAWAKAELERAIVEWRRVFRGEARVKDDTAVTPEEIASLNLVLWGDPSSNQLIAKVQPQLPIQWSKENIIASGTTYSAAENVPIYIYPNPLNPQRYVVLNSGFTFRQGSNQSNAQQTPKLPDWAVVDLRTPPSDTAPGLIVNAGFFDEEWK